MNVGPMLNGKPSCGDRADITGYNGRKLVGSGKVLWDSRQQVAEGAIAQRDLIRNVALSAPR